MLPQIHHDKHHAKYVNVANQMIEGTEMEVNLVNVCSCKWPFVSSLLLERTLRMI